MENRQIHYFIEVVKQGSFSKAAKHLYLSQPTISNVVKDLEDELDVKLLIRNTRKLELTDTGRLLFQYGQQASQLLQHFYQELDDIKNVHKGSIKMGIFSFIGTEILTDLMSEFYKQYPEIIIRFVEDGENNLKNSLIQGDFDLVVMEISPDETFNYLPFLKGDLRLLVHQSHPLANSETVTWAELKNEKFIIFREGFAVHNFIMKECERIGFEPNIICETSQWKLILEMVSYNMGITILPQSSVNEINVSHKGINVLPLIDQQIHWQVGIAWRKEGYISHAARTWIQFLKDQLKQNEKK
jgi:DNA-binding transcriptional LysR family regulator